MVTETPARRGRELTLAAASRCWLEQADQAGAGELDCSVVVASILAVVPDPGDAH
jgi:hypothetical protein